MRWPDARSLGRALGTLEESSLPDALQGVESRGLPSAAFVMAGLFLLWLTNPPIPVLPIAAGVLGLEYLYAVISLRREGFSLGQSQSAIWREPSWWPFWYPRALRRPGNVWERLPAAVRRLRWWVPAVGAYSFLCFAPRPSRFFAVKMAGMAAILVLGTVLRARAKRELRRKGLAPADAHRVMLSVTPSRASFWARPHIAAILAPAPHPDSPRRPDAPHDHLQSILRHADELSGPLRPLGALAAVAGRQLIASIDQSDRDIAGLARNLEPGEEDRLADKIAALAPTPGRTDDQAPMRQLLEKQLELVRGLQARIEEAKDTRTRRVEMLKTLSLHLATLRARSAEPTGEVRSLSDRVKALCDDIAQHPIALAEATNDTKTRS